LWSSGGTLHRSSQRQNRYRTVRVIDSQKVLARVVFECRYLQAIKDRFVHCDVIENGPLYQLAGVGSRDHSFVVRIDGHRLDGTGVASEQNLRLEFARYVVEDLVDRSKNCRTFRCKEKRSATELRPIETRCGCRKWDWWDRAGLEVLEGGDESEHKIVELYVAVGADGYIVV
jgi:hypothetical protein